MHDFEIIQKFASEASLSTNEQELILSFKQALSHFGFDNFCCVSFLEFDSTDPKTIEIAMLPQEWVDRYLRKEYHKSDAIVENMFTNLTPVKWSSIQSVTKKQFQILNEAADFGLVNGMSMPIFVPGISPTSFSISGDNNDINDEIFPLLYVISIYFHEAVLRIRSLRKNSKNEDPNLTPREKECLHWVAAGKSDGVIADILNISSNTVHYHIENAKKKFDLPTRVQTVVKAIFTGKIFP